MTVSNGQGGHSIYASQETSSAHSKHSQAYTVKGFSKRKVLQQKPLEAPNVSKREMYKGKDRFTCAHTCTDAHRKAIKSTKVSGEL